MTKRIAAIIFILLCSTIAWIILGTTIFARTGDSGAHLRDAVESTWGAPQEQTPPSAIVTRVVAKRVEETVDGKKTVRTVEEKVAIPLTLERSRVDVALNLEHRQKGLLWYATYRVAFLGDFVIRNTTELDAVNVTFTFPTERAVYDDLVFTVNGVPAVLENGKSCVSSVVRIAPGAAAALRVGYRSQGLATWHYRFAPEVTQVHDFTLTMKTNFSRIDFPEGTLSPTAKQRAGNGWVLTWRFQNLITGYRIGMLFPEKLQPGPLAGRISFFAPVSLLFFFFVMFLITSLRGIDLHPMNYFFLAAAFFAFHLLLAYLVDHVSIHVAFVIASLVSVSLVVSYLRLVVGTRFAVIEAAGSQLVYLVLFSYAFFFEGYTGLTVTIGAILTLFVVMQLTARVRWSERFAEKNPQFV